MMWRSGLAIALVVVALMAAGCGGNSTVAIFITPAGGSFQFGGVVLSVPPGAVSSPTAIVVLPLAPSGPTPLQPVAPAGLTAVAAVRLEPETTQFNVPVTIFFQLYPAQAAGTQIHFYELVSSTWTDTGVDAQLQPSGQTAVVQITHFGTYALFVG